MSTSNMGADGDMWTQFRDSLLYVGGRGLIKDIVATAMITNNQGMTSCQEGLWVE